MEGSTDMVEIVDLLMAEQRRRRAEGRTDDTIPMRPDHGHLLLDDLTKTTLPGYSNAGHTFGDGLASGQRRALLEYLKTL